MPAARSQPVLTQLIAPLSPPSATHLKTRRRNEPAETLARAKNQRLATASAREPTTEQTPPASRYPEAHMPHDGGERPLVHSSSLLYDGHISGMSSDSELTASGTTRHHHYHHRPYSSQSRVYHAHPVPRSSPASSRLSHYSDSASASGGMSSGGAANVQPSSVTAASLPYVYQQQQQQPAPSMSLMSSAASPLSMGHQGSVSSSGSASSSSYLAGVLGGGELGGPISPVAQQQQLRQQSQPKKGRQLPQRPFKQSMSTDQNPIGLGLGAGSALHHQYQHLAGAPAHQHSLGSADPVGYQQQQRYAHSSQFVGAARNLRHEMNLMEKQAANLNLYDSSTSVPSLDANENPAARLPPSGSLSTSSVRQLPAIGPQSQSLIGSMSLDQQQQQHLRQPQHHQLDAYQAQQQQQLMQQHQDPYAGQSHYAASQADWMPPTSQLSNQLSRAANQFKQTMSIDQYPVGASYQHYSAAMSGPSGGYMGEPSFHQKAAHHYSSGPPSALGGYESPLDQQRVYYSSEEQSRAGDAYESAGHKQHQPKHLVDMNKQHQSMSSSVDHQLVGRSSAAGHGSAATKSASRPALQQQVSSSSSNSNVSFSQKSASNNAAESLYDTHPSEHKKPHASTSGAHHNPSAHYQFSPQHKATTSRPPDLLRRGYTSVTMTSGADLNGSQTALSESGGDVSLTQTSASHHSGQISSLPGRRLRAASPSITNEPGTSSGQHHHQHHHSSSSSHAPGLRSESSTGLPNGSHENSTLTKKSNSATQLSMSGTKKRLGFRKKQVTSFSVHRSEEVAPLEARHLVKQGSSVSEGDSSVSGDSSSRSWSNSNFKQQNSEELASMSFIDGLGKGQMISRQGLASPYLGDIQLSLCDRRGNLEVEVIRARNLQAKTTKVLPLTYVKLYLVKNRKCLAKAKTTLSNKRTLNPLFQQQLTFHEDYHGCILQSIVWGNFGKMDKKNFMGIAQISIDDLELSDTVISWYKLFLPSSLQTLPSKSLRHTLLSNSTESFTNTSNS